jgi:hypothetical protein
MGQLEWNVLTTAGEKGWEVSDVNQAGLEWEGKAGVLSYHVSSVKKKQIENSKVKRWGENGKVEA